MKNFLTKLGWFILFYVVFSSVTYRLNHPSQTEIELFFNLWKALTWNW